MAVDAPQQRLAVIAQGYVGLPLTRLAVEAGYEVVGIDLDHSRIDRPRRVDSYVDDAQLGDAPESGLYTYRLVEREARWILDCRNRLSGVNVEFL